MKQRSLQARLALSLGVLLTVIWVATALLTALILRHEIDETFDASLQETAQHLLPLAVVDILGREEAGISKHIAAVDAHDEFFTYIIRDAQGRILVQSNTADPSVFPPYDGSGFRQTATHRLYNDDAEQGSLQISIAQPLQHRATEAREVQTALILPLLLVIPVSLLTIVVAVRTSLSSLRDFRENLEARNARDLSPVHVDGLPGEITPLATTLNGLLNRLKEAFEAERSFAANAAHELRTPLAGAIAQAQRLQSETQDPAARARAADIEVALKRLTRLSERLMQLARAEGGRLRLDQSTDLRMVARFVVEDMSQATAPRRIKLTLPDLPLMSDLDPDAFGILCRNLIENALRHGSDTDPVTVDLSSSGALTVSNEGPVVPPEALDRLTTRFERAGADTDGSGLGLAIVAAIAERIGSPLILKSPRAGATSGFEIAVDLPIESATLSA